MPAHDVRPVHSGKGWKAYRRAVKIMHSLPPTRWLWPLRHTRTPLRVASALCRRRRRATRPRPAHPLLIMRKVLAWADDDREVIGVIVKDTETRAAHRRGEVPLEFVRTHEREIALALFQTLNPTRAAEDELEMMHEAHNSDKGKRGAVSRKRNAGAREADRKVGGKAPAPAAPPYASAGVDLRGLAGLLLEVAGKHDRAVLSELKRRGHLWTNAYYVGSAGNISADVIQRYIENQRKGQVDDDGA